MHTIAEALLEGRDPEEWKSETALEIADTFLVAVFEVGDDAGSVSDIRNRLDALPGVFLRADVRGWTALVPLTDREELALGRLRELAGDSRCWTGVSVAESHAEIPAAAAEARMVVDVCRTLKRPDNFPRPNDILLEFLIASSPLARRHLLEVAEPLRDQPVLAETLTVYIDCSYNQLAAARQLYVHRNTITYRLNRISELTGYDVSRPRTAMLVLAALIAGKLEPIR